MNSIFKHVKHVTMAAVIAASAFTFAPSVEAADISTGIIVADGYGAPPDNMATPRGQLMARRAAIVDAYRNLVTEVNGVQVDADTTVANSATSNDIIHTHVAGVIKGAKVVSENFADGMYRVTVSLPVFGEQSLAAAVLPVNTTVAPFASPSTFTPAVQPASQPVVGKYTGVVVDCRGLGLSTAMSPVIKAANGQPVYGYKNLDSQFVIKNGMAGYSNTVDDGVNRAGANPLILKAVSVDNGVNPVISDADAAKLLSENQATRFLDATAVVFVK